jgi:hypothetical protein
MRNLEHAIVCCELLKNQSKISKWPEELIKGKLLNQSRIILSSKWNHHQRESTRTRTSRFRDKVDINRTSPSHQEKRSTRTSKDFEGITSKRNAEIFVMSVQGKYKDPK